MHSVNVNASKVATHDFLHIFTHDHRMHSWNHVWKGAWNQSCLHNAFEICPFIQDFKLAPFSYILSWFVLQIDNNGPYT